MKKKPFAREWVRLLGHISFEALQKVHGTDVDVVGVYSGPVAGQAYAEKRGDARFSLEAMPTRSTIHVCTPFVAHAPISIAAWNATSSWSREAVDRLLWRRLARLHWDRRQETVSVRLGERGPRAGRRETQ